MNFEERERQKRQRLIRVAIAELGMVFAVIAIVVVAILLAMGFFVGSDGNIEQSGLIQIHSMPTGGTVEVDGATLFSRTNLSRTMSPGEHTITITRDGYDTWSKTVKMHSGILLRLYYPRLFLQNRKVEKVAALGEELMFYSVANDQTSILYANKESTQWRLVNIKNDEIKTTQLDLSDVLPEVKDKKYLGTVEVVEWSQNSDYVLVKAMENGEKQEWILLNLKDVSRSLNLTKTFGLEFDQVKLVGNSADQMYALENRHLRRINVADQEISRVLLSNVLEFDNYGSDVIYVESEVGEAKQKAVGVYRDGEKSGTRIAIFSQDTALKVALSEYYDESYLIYSADNKMTVLYGVIPSYRENRTNLTDFSELNTLVSELQLATIPEQLEMSLDGEYVMGSKGRQLMVLDLDMGDLYEYEIETNKLRWLAEAMLYAVDADGLRVWEFDNTNQRSLVEYNADNQKSAVADDSVVENADTETQLPKDEKSVTTMSQYPLTKYDAVIASNNKWLYYVVKTDKTLELVREKIRD